MSTKLNWYMSADGIQGDGIQGYTNQVALAGFTQDIYAAASTGSAAAIAICGDPSAYFVADGGVTQIFKALVNGTVIPNIKVSGLKTIGTKPQTFVQYSYTNVYLTAFTMSMGDTDLIVDHLSFNSTTLTFEFWKETNGTLVSTGPTTYDILNQKIVS